MPFPVLVLLELGLLLGGVFGSLLAYGVYRPATRDGPAYRAWYAGAGRRLRLLGPLCLLGAAALPAVEGYGNGPYRSASGLLLGAFVLGCAVYGVRTWRPEPPAPWPRNIVGWLGYAWTSFVLGGVAAGAAASAGIHLSFSTEFALFVPLGLVAARVVTIWYSRHMAWEQRY